MAKKQQRSLFTPTKLYSHTQSSTFQPELHDGPRPLIQIANGLGKSSQQKQTTQDFFILAVKLDIVLMCLYACDKKLNFLSWAIKPVFADPVTFTDGPLSTLLSTLNLGTISSSNLARVPRVAPRMSASSWQNTIYLHDRSQQFAVSRLPKLTLPNFFSNPLEWSTIWDSFPEAFHLNLNLVKYRNLKNQLHEDAARTIAGSSLSDQNYLCTCNLHSQWPVWWPLQAGWCPRAGFHRHAEPIQFIYQSTLVSWYHRSLHSRSTLSGKTTQKYIFLYLSYYIC